MIRSMMVRRGWAALITATTLLLAACSNGSGSGDSGGEASMRVLNATSDVASLDVYLGETKTFPANTTDALSAYSQVAAAGYTVKITSAGATATLFSGTYTLSRDKPYTGVVWGRSGSLKLVTLPEDEDVSGLPADQSKVRIYNATSDTGALDIFLTQNDEDLFNTQPDASAVGGNVLGGYRQKTAGVYRLRVTSAGKPNDLRLDIAGVTLTAKQAATLIITAGPGGLLVHGALLVQQGTVTQFKNTSARLRLAAGVDTAGSLTMKVDGSTVASNLVSPFDGPYALVPAGVRTLDLIVNGAPGPSATPTLLAGGDYTLLAYGTAAAPQTKLLTDDNRLPGAGSYRIRLVNSAANALPATLVIDDGVVLGLNDIAAGLASGYTSGAADSSADLKVSSGSTTLQPLLTAKNLQSLGVYTVFVLGGNAAPEPSLRKDR